MMVRHFVCTIMIALLTVSVMSQVSDSLHITALEEVVVSDSRFELKRAYSGKLIIKIDEQELEKSPGKSVAEIINTKSGIEIAGSRGRPGEVLGVFARGGRGRQVLILIDGIRISDPSSFSQEYDLRLLSKDQIANIEIIKGASSTLYGSNAATAVINITTKKGANKPFSGVFVSSLGTNQTTEDQSYKLADFTNSAHVAGQVDQLNYTMGIAHRYTGGMSSLITAENEEDPFSQFSANIRLGYNLGERFEMSVFGNRTRMLSAYDETFGFVDAPYTFSSDQKRVGLNGKFEYKQGALVLNAAYTDYFSENKSAFPAVFEGKNMVVDLYNKYRIDEQFYGVLGLNYNLDKAKFTNNEDFTMLDPYLNMVYLFNDLHINAGLRLNHHSEYGNHLVYSLNPSYSFTNKTGYFKILGSYATSYITPSLTQLFGQFGANANLEPETNRTYEGGLEYVISGKVRANALYFNRKEENLVFFDSSSFQYLNASSTIDAKGFETELEWNPVAHAQITMNYTFTERKGDNALRIPKHKINANLAYTFSKGTNTSISYAYTGVRTDTDFNSFEDIALKPFSLVGLYISQDLKNKDLRLFLSVDNLFNSNYVEVIGFSTRGRNIRFGFQLQL